MNKSRRVHWLSGLLTVLVLAAPCCGGGSCDAYFEFYDPVPPMTLAPGDTTSYELLNNVWAIVHSCSGNETGRSFPRAEAFSNDPTIASVRLDTSSVAEIQRNIHPLSLLRIEAHKPGQTQIVLRARTEVNCEDVYDATHFTITVSANSPAAP